jgi:hypothetical protein
VVQFLLTQPGINVNAVSAECMSVLSYAVAPAENDEEIAISLKIVEELVKIPALDVAFVDADGMTAIEMAENDDGMTEIVNALKRHASFQDSDDEDRSGRCVRRRTE